MKKKRILLTGATGYVGSRLLDKLATAGHEVNCLVRDPSNLWNSNQNVHIFQGDVLVRSSMWRAFRDVDTAYFLVHFLEDRDNFEAKEIEAAENFASMARSAGVKRIIYLGALGSEEDNLSPHLQSRQDVGYVLRSSGIATIELRASIVIGEDSLSYNLIRDLTEHLPIMIMPKWVTTKSQPIDISSLLDYLFQSLEVRITRNEIIEIGGADQLSYRDLMIEYAKQRGLKRLTLPVPVLTPWLSSHWVSFFSPISFLLARRLLAGIKNPTVVTNDRAKQLFGITPKSVCDAIQEAVVHPEPEAASLAPLPAPH